MSEKVTGYVLLVVGLLIMVFSTFATYSTLSKGTTGFEFFHLTAADFSSTPVVSGGGIDSNAVSVPKVSDIIPVEPLNKSLNVGIYSLFLFFILSLGYKVATLGVYMLRPINVKLHEAKN